MNSEGTFGRYNLIERIAYGGMAEVFRASYSPTPGFDKVLVLKRILPHLSANERFIRMFQDEAAITVHLTHPNIVQVFDFGHVNGVWFLAMEYVHGRNLRQLLERTLEDGRRLPVEMVAYISREIARGLDYAHSARDSRGRPLGIVHRDLNPPNILLSYQGDVKIGDFGVAKAARRLEQSDSGKAKGKVDYMAPEVLEGRSFDYRADLWALGCVTYEMLTGMHPFGKRGVQAPAARALKITTDAHVPLSQRVHGVPELLDRAVEGLLQKDPEARSGSAEEIVILLDAVADTGARRVLRTMMQEMFEDEKRQPLPGVAADLSDFSSDGLRIRQPPRLIELDDPEGEPLELATRPPEQAVTSSGTSDVPWEIRDDAITGDTVSSEPEPASAPTMTPSGSAPGVPVQNTSSASVPGMPLPGQPPRAEPSRLIPLMAVLLIGGTLTAVGVINIWQWSGQALTNVSAYVGPGPGTSGRSTEVDDESLHATGTEVEDSVPIPNPEVEKIELVITSRPEGAEARVNGRPVGNTPVTHLVPVGALVHVEVSHKGRRAFREIISLPEGRKNHSVHAKLPKLRMGTLSLKSRPSAEIFVNDEPLGRRTPARALRLPEGIHRIRLENRARGLSREVVVEIPPGATVTENVVLDE